ncbi:protein of unknown function [Algoriphagus locisalis]|uniref:DUF4221 domain-containing protein n=1 Tax=Algoriphagus locisalis TaxID=305507 RepID=A0A1I7ANV2_9BACT|nr:DUF4221 family protein [Algoriphagus locisalis]SFT76628.1 protein of unknown function [Algoriphagus locisalis]
MKKTRFLFLIFLAVLTSCSTKESAENTEATTIDFSYEIDTVQVDPGDDHFIYLSNYMNTATLSSDKKLLYNFNPKVPELEVIDLDELTIKEVIKLEKEGPYGINAANSYMAMMDISDNGDLYLNNWNYMIKLNEARDQVSKYWFTADSLKGDPMTQLEKIYPEGQISKDGKFFYSTYGIQDNKSPKSGLAIVNLNTMELKKVPIDLFEKIDKFSIVFSPEGNSKMEISETVFFNLFQDKILISSTTYNEVFTLDLADETVAQKSFHSELTNDEKEGNYQKRANSREELDEHVREKAKEVTFGKLHFDDQNEKFWRFSISLDRMIGDSATYQSVLTIFDKELTQIHEQRVSYLMNVPSFLTFFKDGSLYSYINLEDELGFVRIKPTYEKN